MYGFISLLLLFALFLPHHKTSAEECGTRFTDFTSSVVMAEVVLQGQVNEFNPSPVASRLRTANISVGNIYKGMGVLKSSGGMDSGSHLVVQSFGQESKEDCVATASESLRGKDMVFFLRTSPNSTMMQHSALPLAPRGNEARRVKRAMCETCIQPPTIRRLVCKDCARAPTIKPMKSKKVTMGRRARLRCSVRGKPTPTISWYKNQLPVTNGNGGVTIRSTALTSMLVFTKTTSVHSGQYKCVASNDVGNAEEFASLEIMARKRKAKVKNPVVISVEHAADRVQCTSNPCLNGGTCFFSPALNLRQCVCAVGFEGVKCENIRASASRQNRIDYDPRTTRKASTSPIVSSTNHSQIGRGRTHGSTIAQTTSFNSLPTTFTTKSYTQPSGHQITQTSVTRQPTVNANIIPTAKTVDSRSFAGSRTNPRPPSRFGSNGQRHSSYPVKRKSSLKIIPCKEKNFCTNRGKCRYISKLRKKFCQCRKGYGGTRCEILL